MSQVIQNVVDMAIDFKRSCGYSFPTFKVQHVSSINSSSYRSNKLTTKSMQLTSIYKKTKMLALPGRTLQKGLPNSSQAKFPPKIQIHQGKAVHFNKNFCKKFQNKRQINELCTPASNSSEEFNNFILEFENIMLEDLEDSSV